MDAWTPCILHGPFGTVGDGGGSTLGLAESALHRACFCNITVKRHDDKATFTLAGHEPSRRGGSV